MRIARGNEIIGEWSVGQIKIRMTNTSLVPTDLYYDEESSEWLPLSELPAKRAAPKAVKEPGRSCYCGSGLPFGVCHGDGSLY
ncbi:MAG: hypothetical protein ABSE62_17065 [Chthoniobacteraceae bacterium]